MTQTWQQAQEWEQQWHDDCANSYNEETKQYIYAQKMGLNEFATNWYGRRGWNFGKLSVLDVGGGPYSLLLKSKAKKRTVIDPCKFPNWVTARYQECGIDFINKPAEQLPNDKYDLALIYNCLQHVASPRKIIEEMKRVSKEIRIFEWIDTPVTDGHLHTLHADVLDNWLGGHGATEYVKQSPVVGWAYYGIFIT